MFHPPWVLFRISHRKTFEHVRNGNLCGVTDSSEGLGRKALAVGQEHAQLQSSAVLGAAHQRIAYSALVDEFLAQLRVLSSSGLEAGVPPPALETDTGTESDDEPAPIA